MFISDMYHSEQCIRQGLERLGIIKNDEHLYVSCECLASKYAGTLFAYVQQREHIPYSQWHHYGDNRHSDYIVPTRIGIHAHLLRNTEATEFEHLAEKIAFYSDDKISAALFGHILRAVRLQRESDDGGFLSNMMCGTIVPYVVACLNDARQKNIKRLYFASRDAYIMYLVARELSGDYPEIELRYLYISTKVVYPLLIRQGSVDELNVLFRNIGTFAPRKILDMLGFDSEQQKEIASHLNIDATITWNSTEAELLVSLILDPEWREQLLNSIACKRALFLDYLRQEQFVSDTGDDVGLVDIGWRCSTQRILATIIPNNVMYYYYGVSDDNFRYDQMGEYKAWYYMSKGHYFNHRFFEGYICRNLENTLIGYYRDSKGNIVPLFADGKVPEWLEQDFQLRLKYLKSCSAYVRQYPCLMMSMGTICSSYSQRIVEQFSQVPPQSMCRFLSDKLEWDHYTDTVRMIRKLRPTEYLFARFLPNSGIVKKYYRNSWLNASVSFTYGTKVLRLLQAFEGHLAQLKHALP